MQKEDVFTTEQLKAIRNFENAIKKLNKCGCILDKYIYVYTAKETCNRIEGYYRYQIKTKPDEYYEM